MTAVTQPMLDLFVKLFADNGVLGCEACGKHVGNADNAEATQTGYRHRSCEPSGFVVKITRVSVAPGIRPSTPIGSVRFSRMYDSRDAAATEARAWNQEGEYASMVAPDFHAEVLPAA
jgi:hypothetical protein